jgi:hypothetical protein
MLATIRATEPVEVVHTNDPAVKVSKSIDDDWIPVALAKSIDEGATRVSLRLMNSDTAARHFPDSIRQSMPTAVIFAIVDDCVSGIDPGDGAEINKPSEIRKWLKSLYFQDRLSLGAYIIKNSMTRADPLDDNA